MGEGERKLFRRIKKCDFHDDVVALYGLDEDLVASSTLRARDASNARAFREAPDYYKEELDSNFLSLDARRLREFDVSS